MVKDPPITLNDLAKAVGINKTTVSAVLNGGRTNTRVSTETRERILNAAATLNYRPSAIGKSLRQRSTDIIGFYSGYREFDTRDPFNVEVIHGLQMGAEAHGKDLLMHGSVRGRSPEGVHRELANGKVDGLILISPPNNPLVPLLAESALPVVAIADTIPSLPSVVVDDAGGSRLIARYLADKGHKRVLYRKSYLKTASDLRRLNAFCEAAVEYGITVVETVETFWYPGLYEAESAWLMKPPGERPTAIVCWHDEKAYRAIDACLAAGLRVPEDVAIVGFDGFVWQEKPAHQLTTIRAFWPDVARKAVELLVARIRGEEIPMETVMPVELIVGETA